MTMRERLSVVYQNTKPWLTGALAATTVISALTLYYVIRQTSIRQQQLDYERSRQPDLKYKVTMLLDANDHEVIIHAAQQVSQQFYAALACGQTTSRANTHSGQISRVLPIETAVSPRPVIASIEIRNAGAITASKVRVSIKTDSTMSSLSVDSMEPYRTLNGGIGQSSILIEIDRIVAGASTTLSATLAASQDSGLDKVVLAEAPHLLISRIRTDRFLDRETVFTSDLALDVPGLPMLQYFPARDPHLEVTVSSEEGIAKQDGPVETCRRM